MPTDRPGVARLTDDRVTAPGILPRLRPGPRASLEPMAPGPRPRVSPSALLAHRMRVGARWALQLAIQAGGRPAPPPPYTSDDARAVGTVRKAGVGRAAPMTYRTTYVAPFRSSAVAETEAGQDAIGGGAAARLPCVDCG